MSRETIYNFYPFSNDEKYLLLTPTASAWESRRHGGVPFEHMEDFMTEEEYMLHKTDEDKVYDMFLLFRHRGEFEKARKYETLANYDAVKSFESAPRDMFIRNEYEYYKWRKGV